MPHLMLWHHLPEWGVEERAFEHCGTQCQKMLVPLSLTFQSIIHHLQLTVAAYKVLLGLYLVFNCHSV